MYVYDFRTLLKTCGDAQFFLAKELMTHEMDVESQVLSQIHNILEVRTLFTSSYFMVFASFAYRIVVLENKQTLNLSFTFSYIYI